MKIIHTQQDIINAIESLNVDDSLAVTFIHGALDVQSVIAIRNAERICDHVVVVNLSETPLNKLQQSVVNRAGGYLLLEPETIQEKCTVETSIKNINSTVILQSILTVMPLVVTVAENNTHLIKVLKNILDTFGELFALHLKSTPVNLLTAEQRNLRTCLTTTLLEIQAGESDANLLKQLCAKALEQANFKVNNVSFIDSDTFEEHLGVVSPTALIHVKASYNGHTVQDILSLIEK